MSRAETLLAPLDRSARIIEIGPSYNPIAPKAAGWNTSTLDHTTRASLVEKYRGHPGVDVDRIEEVDFVWTSGSVADAVPSDLHGTFDAFIASHVIEHTTDLVGFLDAAATLARPERRRHPRRPGQALLLRLLPTADDDRRGAVRAHCGPQPPHTPHRVRPHGLRRQERRGRRMGTNAHAGDPLLPLARAGGTRCSRR